MPGVEELYDQDPEGEWLRLVKSPYRSLEFSLTMRCLRKHLPARGKVLDAGGGPGRYSTEAAVVDMGEHMLYVGRKGRRRARSRARIQAVKP